MGGYMSACCENSCKSCQKQNSSSNSIDLMNDSQLFIPVNEEFFPDQVDEKGLLGKDVHKDSAADKMDEKEVRGTETMVVEASQLKVPDGPRTKVESRRISQSASPMLVLDMKESPLFKRKRSENVFEINECEKEKMRLDMAATEEKRKQELKEKKELNKKMADLATSAVGHH